MNMEQRWLDYIEQNKIDGLFFYNPEDKIFMTLYEGTGDNLLPEDEEEGYVDYWMADVFSEDGNIDGAQIMCETLIRESNQTIDEIIGMVEESEMVMSIGSLPLMDYIVRPEYGECLEDAYNKIDAAIFDKRMAENKYNTGMKLLNNLNAYAEAERGR
jgi:hypothetical protein